MIVAEGVDDAGGAVVTVSTWHPWHIDSASGESTFVVRPDQLERASLSADGNPRVVTLDADGKCAVCRGTE